MNERDCMPHSTMNVTSVHDLCTLIAVSRLTVPTPADKPRVRAIWSTPRMPIRIAFGRACLDTRIALDVSREDLADRVGVTPSYIGRIERGESNLSLRLVESIADALGLDIQLIIRTPTFPGGPRVKDAVHARCSAYADRRLRALGWSTAREIEIVHGRSHGWIDLLAFDRRSGTLLVIEVKTRLDDLGALERTMSWYERMAWQAAQGLGWRPTRVVPLVLALASDEVERVVRSHRDLLGLAFPVRATEMNAMLVRPEASFKSRGLALIDPSSRRAEWLIRTSVDGRRSKLPYLDYADAARPAASSIARAPADTNAPSEPSPMNRNPRSSSGARPAAS
jgi:transcriptional regulator with XRE-family HTH domain